MNKPFSFSVVLKWSFWLLALGLLSIDAYFLLSNLQTSSIIEQSSAKKLDFREPIENEVLGRYVYFENFTDQLFTPDNRENYIGPLIGHEFEFFDLTASGKSRENYILFQIVDVLKQPLQNKIVPGNFLMLDLGDFPLIVHNSELPEVVYLKVEEHNFNAQEPISTLDRVFIQFLAKRTFYDHCQRGEPVSVPTNKNLKQTKEFLSYYSFDTRLFQHDNRNGYQVFTPLQCNLREWNDYVRDFEYKYTEGKTSPRKFFYEKVNLLIDQKSNDIESKDLSWYLRRS